MKSGSPYLPGNPVFLEVLEPRIAPASVASAEWVPATNAGGSFVLSEGQGLATGAAGGGAKLLFVEKGQALVFTTDLNGNNLVDTNEITGISAGNGLRLISFTDINGDIVTNLNPDGRTLTDSDGNSANGLDGKVVLNSRIDSIVMRSLIAGEVPDPAGSLSKSNYSIFGNIYAGGGLGAASGQGLLIDTSGFALQAKFGRLALDEGVNPVPMVGYILTGSAVSGQMFSFGTGAYGNDPAESLRGILTDFIPSAGQAGGDVVGVRAVGADGQPAVFYLGGITTGDGGPGARGGDILNIVSRGDIGGLVLRTGSGGDGESGGRGGDITGLSITDSVNSRVEIITGDGGFGLLGKAGRAGNVLFNGDVVAYGNIQVGLGNGGGAVGDAGAGTSLTNGTFTNPGVGLQLPTEVITTWRLPGDIGNYAFNAGQYISRQFDFDSDGFNDAVYISNNANQIVVLFGNRAGGLDFRPDFSQLDSPSYAPLTARASALVVAEIGGPVVLGPNPLVDPATPLPDIVTASSSGTSGVGLVSFVNLGLDDNGVWLGFALPRYSPLPGADIPGVTPAGVQVGRSSLAAVTTLVAGNFTRDFYVDPALDPLARSLQRPWGIVDIALIETRYDNTAAPFISNLIVMSGLRGPDGLADGFFAADFGKGAGTVRNSVPAVNIEFGRGSEAFAYQMKATAATAVDRPGLRAVDSDVFAYIDRTNPIPGHPGNTLFYPYQMIDNAAPTPGQTLRQIVPGGVGGTPFLYSERTEANLGVGQVWTGYGAQQPISVYNFEFLDADNDGFFDAVGIGNVRPVPGSVSQPYLAAAVLQGGLNTAPLLNPGQFEILQIAQPDARFGAQTYFGIALTEKTDNPNIPSVLGTNWTDVVSLGLATGSYDAGTGALGGTDIVLNIVRDNNSVARAFAAGVGQYPLNTAPAFRQTFLPSGPGLILPGVRAADGFSAIGTANLTEISLFEPWQQTAGVAPRDMVNVGFILNPNPDANPETRWTLQTPTTFRFISTSTIEFQAGAGGNSFLGRGGDGGSLGGSALVVNPGGNSIGALTINGYGGVSLVSGPGGFGNLGGGKGGGISGIAAQANSFTAISGIGGASLSGKGGAGGSIGQIFVQGQGVNPSVALTTGGGGFGLTGGAGGNVTGGQNTAQADVQGIVELRISAGNGGAGIKLGGLGGTVKDFNGDLFEIGLLDLRAGSGGSAVSGVGGAGGSIVASAPVPQTSLISNPMVVSAGNGGNGMTGGAGGSVTNFVYLPDTPPRNPETVRILAGNGGSGVTGKGGVGGGLSDVAVAGESVALLSVYMAGDGGESSAGAGGAGGSISKLNGAAVAGGAMAVAGAGGNGLTAGGAGGSVRQTNLDVGGNTTARVLFMAGAGGSAYGVTERQMVAEGTTKPLPDPAFPKPFALGSVNGRAGAGGNLSDLKQLGATGASSDLIAGNGGNLVNYGTGADTKIPIGRGGSVTNVQLSGDAGRMEQNALINSYAFDFSERLRNGTITSANDAAVGNVGVVVGSKGYGRNDAGVTGGVTGSVKNFSAGNIMSMVAGSVDRVAKITSIDNLAVTSGNAAVLGAAKNDPLSPIPPRNPATTPAYLAPDGVTVATALQSGGSLIDGAIFTSRYDGLLNSLRFFKG